MTTGDWQLCGWKTCLPATCTVSVKKKKKGNGPTNVAVSPLVTSECIRSIAGHRRPPPAPHRSSYLSRAHISHGSRICPALVPKSTHHIIASLAQSSYCKSTRTANGRCPASLRSPKPARRWTTLPPPCPRQPTASSATPPSHAPISVTHHVNKAYLLAPSYAGQTPLLAST